ncbi:unnamed protein product, partial [Polarella glacialis]
CLRSSDGEGPPGCRSGCGSGAVPGQEPQRAEDARGCCSARRPCKVEEATTRGISFVEVDAGPTGCMLIKRKVFDVMREAYPDLQCRICGTHAGRSKRYDVWWRFFDTMVTEDGEFLGEDIAFCRRWRAIGGTIFADLGATLTHVGRHAFTGNMLDSLPLSDLRRQLDADG